MADEEVHLEPVEARGGTRNPWTRYVLIISLALVIIAFAVILLV